LEWDDYFEVWDNYLEVQDDFFKRGVRVEKL